MKKTINLSDKVKVLSGDKILWHSDKINRQRNKTECMTIAPKDCFSQDIFGPSDLKSQDEEKKSEKAGLRFYPLWIKQSQVLSRVFLFDTKEMRM